MKKLLTLGVVLSLTVGASFAYDSYSNAFKNAVKQDVQNLKTGAKQYNVSVKEAVKKDIEAKQQEQSTKAQTQKEAKIKEDCHPYLLFCKEHREDIANRYTGKDVLFEDTEYLVSERINFVSEWRCFVYRGQLKGIKHYLDDEWVMPDKDFVNECISAIGNSLIAYTLDIGVTEDGKSAVIEAHNFLSCGLYGFENQAVIPMLTNAFKHELNTQPD